MRRPKKQRAQADVTSHTQRTLADEIERGRRIAERLQDEARAALQAWAVVKASGFLLPKQRQRSRNMLSLRWTGAHHDLVVIALRDVLLTLWRMTEPANKDRQSLLALYDILNRVEIRDELLRQATVSNAALCRAEIDLFLARFRTRNVSPVRRHKIPDLRAPIEPIRHRVLAHALESNDAGSKIGLRQIRLLLVAAARLSQAASLIVLGTRFEPLRYYRTTLAAHRLLCKALEDHAEINGAENWIRVTPGDPGPVFVQYAASASRNDAAG